MIISNQVDELKTLLTIIAEGAGLPLWIQILLTNRRDF